MMYSQWKRFQAWTKKIIAYIIPALKKQWSALLVTGLSSMEASRVATIRRQSLFPLSILILRVNAATGLIAQIKFASAGLTKKLQVRF